MQNEGGQATGRAVSQARAAFLPGHQPQPEGDRLLGTETKQQGPGPAGWSAWPAGKPPSAHAGAPPWPGPGVFRCQEVQAHLDAPVTLTAGRSSPVPSRTCSGEVFSTSGPWAHCSGPRPRDASDGPSAGSSERPFMWPRLVAASVPLATAPVPRTSRAAVLSLDQVRNFLGCQEHGHSPCPRLLSGLPAGQSGSWPAEGGVALAWHRPLWKLQGMKSAPRGPILTTGGWGGGS